MQSLHAVGRCAGAILLISGIYSAAAAADFPTVVENILRSQTSGPMAKMDEPKKAAMIACVKQSLFGLPNGQKRQIAAGATLDAQEKLFGQVVMADHAKWKQQIAHDCASIAMKGGA